MERYYMLFFTAFFTILFFLFLLPMSIGCSYAIFYKKRGIEFFIYALPMGFAVEYGIFGILCEGAKNLKLSFNTLALLFSTLSIIAFLFLVFFMYKRRKIFNKEVCEMQICAEKKTNKIIEICKKNPYIFLLLTVFIVQIARNVFFVNSSYYDDKAYNSDVLNIIYSNSLLYVEKRYTASLYEFEAFLSFVSGLHPLIVCDTIWRGYIILSEYAIAYLFADKFFQTFDKKIMFCTVWSVLTEVTFQSRIFHDTFVLLRYANWGKAMVVFWAPLFFLQLYKCGEKCVNKLEIFYAVILSLALCVSNTGGIAIAVFITAGHMVSWIIKKNSFRKCLAVGGASMLPAIVQILIFIYKFR